jgi:hypothetical protein
MEPIFLYFGAGLLLSLLVGIGAYYAVGHAATPLVEELFGQQAGPLWGRVFRLAIVTVALAGGLSVKFYGCRGPTDYRAVAQSHDLMLKHTAEQTGRAMEYEISFLLLAGAFAAIVFAGLRRSAKAAKQGSSRRLTLNP